MKSGLVFILIILMGCYSSKQSKQDYTVLDTPVIATNISFFGKFRYETSPLSKREKQFFVFFKSDSLKAISSGIKKPSSKENWFNTFLINDSITILVSAISSKYLITDTLVFFDNRCFNKRIYYDYANDAGRTRLPALTEINQYDLKDNKLIESEKRYHINDTASVVKVLANYPAIRVAEMKTKIDLKQSGRVLEEYSDENVAKLMFFRKYILQ